MPRTMEGSSFATQSNALFRKNLAFQKRNIKTNFCLVLFPVLVCGLLIVIQIVVDGELNGPENKCGCRCVDETNKDTKNCEKICGIEYSTLDQAFSCAIPNPPQWPPFLQVPRQEFRAVRTPTADELSPAGLPEETCRQNRTCPVTVLYTGQDQIFATNVSRSFFPESNPVDGSSLDILDTLSYFTLGTDTDTENRLFLEPGLFSSPIYNILSSCNATGSDFDQISIPLIGNSSIILQNDVQCTEARNVWSENSSIVNDALFKGYRKSNKEGLINEIMTAYDFLNSSSQNFNLEIWYNASLRRDALIGGGGPPELLRVNRAINTVSNAYLQTIKGSTFRILFKFIKEMPKPATKLSLDFSSLLGPIFFTWIVELLLPVFLTYLVYEKQQKLRIMMKMHGLGDGAYWLISYGYFLLISIVYILLFIIFGSLIGLKYFTLNNRGIQFVFFFSYINLQIALAFLLATRFSHVKTAQGLAYIYVFGSGLVATFLFQVFIEDTTFARHWLILMELIPAFSLYRGLYEFGQYAFKGNYMGTSGMTWSDLSDGENGMAEVLIIIIIEWSLFLSLAYFLDQLASSGSDFRREFCNHFFKKKLALASTSQKFEENEAKVNIELEKPDIIAERMIVENIIRDGSTNYAVVADNLKKTYPGRDGNPKKLAVKDLSLALPLGECFGFLGPNGAGKSSFINMMIGLVSPTSGNAVVHGHSILTNMNQIYTNMGVCPQHDLLWEMLTGREHLLFYGRLKNLKGSTLLEAVDESLRSVNLFNGGVADKKAGKYSGGMKRRLSVAISLIGDPKVVYMDEPSTGLDPASRNSLWNAVKAAKRNRAIILTTHSMEEAEVLCDRLGIFVNGTMQCIGNAKQLRARYGGSYIFTMTTSGTETEQQVENLVLQLSPNAQKIYQISGTQKFEIPKHNVKISDIFKSVEDAKKKFSIQAWGISDTTLEDVFIKVAKTEDSINV